jgi:DNA-binding GntR family transcriptional regulator
MTRLRLPDRESLADQAHEALRAAILDRTLRAGTRLVMRDLVEQLELSPTPISQALVALEAEGLVESRPHRGYHVIALTLDDVHEIYTLREVIEGLAVRLAARNDAGPLADRLAQLRDAQGRCCGAGRGDLARYADLDLDFHRAIWQASGNGRLLRTAETLMGQVRLLISTSAAVPGRLAASIEEHDAIVRHLREGAARKAEADMRRHVRNAARALLNHAHDVAEHGDPPGEADP